MDDGYKVSRLKKCLYYLKQISRDWYRFSLMRDFVISGYDSCVYMLKINEKIVLYILLYVGHILMAGSSKKEIGKLKKNLNW